MKEKNKKYTLNNSKEELINKALNAKTFKIIKYSAIAVGGIYISGYIFKVVAFTVTNLLVLKRSFTSQN